MSALGQKQTCALQNVMSATAKADMRVASGHVCFTPESGHDGAPANVCFGPIVLKKSAVATHDVH